MARSLEKAMAPQEHSADSAAVFLYAIVQLLWERGRGILKSEFLSSSTWLAKLWFADTRVSLAHIFAHSCRQLLPTRY